MITEGLYGRKECQDVTYGCSEVAFSSPAPLPLHNPVWNVRRRWKRNCVDSEVVALPYQSAQSLQEMDNLPLCLCSRYTGRNATSEMNFKKGKQCISCWYLKEWKHMSHRKATLYAIVSYIRRTICHFCSEGSLYQNSWMLCGEGSAFSFSKLYFNLLYSLVYLTGTIHGYMESQVGA